jgi:transaldolase/glucose-6-phosphate isomerase
MNNVDGDLEEQARGLEAAGHPIVRINLKDKLNVSQEIFGWEMAVAAAGAVLGIHPFNQPNVQLAKDLARKMMEKAEKGVLDAEDVEEVTLVDPEVLTKALKSWMGKTREGDYIAIQAYLSPTPETTKTLQKIRRELLNRLRIATTIGYGPRFLHSTGQLHKGGPNTGLFLQLVDETAEDLAVPETNYTFGTLIKAQALGDYRALKQLGRRILRINLEKDVAGGLVRLLNLTRK